MQINLNNENYTFSTIDQYTERLTLTIDQN